MAERYRGRYSPGEPGRAEPRADLHHPYESRTKWITIAAIPFLLSAFWQEPMGMVANLAAFGLVAFASRLTREGLQAEAAYDARRVARRPAWPRKLFGGVLTGLGLACRDAFADGGDLARDDHDVLARADRLRRDKLDRRGLEHRIAGVDAERDTLNFNHTQCIHLAAFLISM